MQIEPNINIKPSFCAKVSPQFEKFARSYINCGKKRLENNYKLNKTIKDFTNYGFDDYTVNLVNRTVAWGNEYCLVATKDGQNIKEGIFITKASSVKKIIDEFINMNKNIFNKLMRKKCRYYT